MRTAAHALSVFGAAAAWACAVGYWRPAAGGWRRSREGWHLMTFTASIALIFTLLVLVRVVDVPGVVQLYLLLIAAVDAGLLWRFALMQTATRRDRRQS